MFNETFMAHTSLRLQDALKEAGPVVVKVASNVRYGEEGNKRKKVDREPFRRLTACCITEEIRVFLANGEKNLIYEASVANPPTVEIISKNFKNPNARLLICESLGISIFYLASGKISRQVLC